MIFLKTFIAINFCQILRYCDGTIFYKKKLIQVLFFIAVIADSVIIAMNGPPV